MKKNTGILIYFVLTILLGVITVIMIPYALSRNELYIYLILLILIISIILSGIMLNKYKNMIEFFDIAYYISNEREEFARIVHDEIIQDLYGIINNLSLNNPDIDVSIEIARNLELKTRNIMKQYRNTLLGDVDVLDNFKSIIYDVESLYPSRRYNVEMNVELDENIISNEINSLRVLYIITKELLNNIYKHSNGDKISLRIHRVADGYKIVIISDGTNEEDYYNILNSKSGVLFIKFLVNSNGGDIEYFYNDGILKTEVFIKGDEIEDNNTRWS